MDFKGFLCPRLRGPRSLTACKEIDNAPVIQNWQGAWLLLMLMMHEMIPVLISFDQNDINREENEEGERRDARKINSQQRHCTSERVIKYDGLGGEELPVLKRKLARLVNGTTLGVQRTGHLNHQREFSWCRNCFTVRNVMAVSLRLHAIWVPKKGTVQIRCLALLLKAALISKGHCIQLSFKKVDGVFLRNIVWILANRAWTTKLRVPKEWQKCGNLYMRRFKLPSVFFWQACLRRQRAGFTMALGNFNLLFALDCYMMRLTRFTNSWQWIRKISFRSKCLQFIANETWKN